MSETGMGDFNDDAVFASAEALWQFLSTAEQTLAQLPDVTQAQRFGRALGTWVRQQHGAGQAPVVLSHQQAGPYRDALLQTLVVSGHRVFDVGAASETVVMNIAAHVAARVTVFVDVLGQVRLWPTLNADDEQRITSIDGAGAFCAGIGGLEVIDTRSTSAVAAFLAQPRSAS